MTDDDRTVQVPVALIKKALRLTDDPWLIVQYRALLSPQTPPALPVRIRDMAVGTTFSAHMRGGVLRRKFQRVEEHPPPYDGWLVGEPVSGSYWKPCDIDSSTISDVTPPAVTA